MTPFEMIGLTPLLKQTSGAPEIKVALIDGPIATSHPELSSHRIREIAGNGSGECARHESIACMHGTFVAGILNARRDSTVPGICPDCTLLLRPVFTEAMLGNPHIPSASPQELAKAILECMEAGAHCINLSLALAQPSTKSERELEQVLDHAAQKGVLIVAAAGNQGTLGSSAIIRHPWVIPVAACDSQGRPLNESNLGSSIGRRGLSAPGTEISGLSPDGKSLRLGGTSVATPFVTGALALLWSVFPEATASHVNFAITQGYASRRKTIVPPLLNAWASYQFMLASQQQRKIRG